MPVLNLSGAPGFAPALPSWAWAASAAWSAWAALLGGSGLLRMSLRVEVEDDGVKTGDWLESLAAAFGDAAPSFESLFFLEDLLESLPRESCTQDKVNTKRKTDYPVNLRLWRRNASSLKTTASLLSGDERRPARPFCEPRQRGDV